MSFSAKKAPNKLILKATIIFALFTHPQLAQSGTQNHYSHAFAVSFAALKQCLNKTTALKPAAAKIGALFFGIARLITLPIRIPIAMTKWFYHLIWASDEYYITRATNMLADLRKDEATLLNLSKCPDDNSIVDILLTFAQANEDSGTALALFDQHLKNSEATVKSMLTQLKKRLNKPAGRKEETIKEMEDCANKLDAWRPLLTNACKAIERYSCFVEIFLLCKQLSIDYEKEIRCIETHTSAIVGAKINKIVDKSVQEANSTYDSHTHKLVSKIVKLEQCLAICSDISIKKQWIITAVDLLEKLKKLATILMVSQKYLDAVKDELSQEYWRGYASNIPIIIPIHETTITPPQHIYHRSFYPIYYPAH